MNRPDILGLAIALGCAAASFGSAHAQTPAQVRVEVPIRDVVLSDGAHRYAVRIKVGGTEMDAGLDSGSSGLRILPNVLAAADAEPGREKDEYGYGSGAQLKGVVGKATVAIGGLAGLTQVQLVQQVGCLPAKPDCAAGRVPLAKYGIQGDGLPGEGFKAILGVNMAKAEIPGLFAGIGAVRWIIDLPRPGESRPGRLVLNPTDDEVKAYVRLPVVERFANQPGGFHDSINGCILNASTKAKACGPVLLDTGAPGIKVNNGDLGRQPWPNGAQAVLGFYSGAGKLLADEAFLVGQKNQASHLSFEQAPTPKGTVIYSGLAVYFAFSVLYDPLAQELGLAARTPSPGGAVGRIEK